MNDGNEGSPVSRVWATDAATDLWRTAVERSPSTGFMVANFEDRLLKATWFRLLPCDLDRELLASLRPSKKLAVSRIWAAG